MPKVKWWSRCILFCTEGHSKAYDWSGGGLMAVGLTVGVTPLLCFTVTGPGF